MSSIDRRRRLRSRAGRRSRGERRAESANIERRIARRARREIAVEHSEPKCSGNNQEPYGQRRASDAVGRRSRSNVRLSRSAADSCGCRLLRRCCCYPAPPGDASRYWAVVTARRNRRASSAARNQVPDATFAAQRRWNSKRDRDEQKRKFQSTPSSKQFVKTRIVCTPTPRPRMSLDVSDESSITAEWLENILQLYYSSNGRELLDGPKNDSDGDDAGEPDDAKKDRPPTEYRQQTVRIDQFRVRPGCEDGENLLSDLLAIDVDLSRDDGTGETSEQLHLMAKLLSQDPFCRHFILEAGFDVREIHFYTTLLPALTQFCGADETQTRQPWPVPPCYYAKYRQGSDSVLVLENMKSCGYSVADFQHGLTLGESIAAVEAVAKIHASVLAYRRRLGADLGQAFPFLFRPEAAAESYQQLLERGLPQLASFLHTSAADQPELHAVLAKLHKLRPKARETIANLLTPASPIATLTHTDFWCNNLLFRRADSAVECCILDWQMATYSRPTNDLALLLVTSVSGEIRRGKTACILDAYWAKFCSTASAMGLDVEAQLNYGRRELDAEYEQSLLLAVLLGIGSVDLAIGNTATEQRLCELLLDLSNDKIF